MSGEKCVCGCGAPAKIRGLAKNCYQNLYRRVKDGQTTWEEEQNAGKILPVSHVYRLRGNAGGDHLCLMGCGKPAVSRGLCGGHYRTVHQRIRRGKTTWETEAREGRALRAKPGWTQKAVRGGTVGKHVVDALIESCNLVIARAESMRDSYLEKSKELLKVERRIRELERDLDDFNVGEKPEGEEEKNAD